MSATRLYMLNFDACVMVQGSPELIRLTIAQGVHNGLMIGGLLWLTQTDGTQICINPKYIEAMEEVNDEEN